MTQLKILRRQLAALRRRRRAVRWLTAYSALISAVIWAVIGIFAADIFFFKLFDVALDAPQRVILIVLGATAAFAAFYFFTRPLIGVCETTEDMALLVERNQQIDSDLIAALQFESPDAVAWGSPQLEHAVIDYVAKAGRAINVFDGFSIEQMVRRVLILSITVGTLAALHVLFPIHTQVFWHRIAMSADHYPTETVIDRIVLNHQVVFERSGYECQPASSIAPQGRPLNFTIQCRGDLPEAGTVEFISSGDGPAHEFKVELKRLSHEQRLARLRQGQARIEAAISDPGIDLKGPWQQQLADLLGFDAPSIVELLPQASQDRDKLGEARDKLGAIIKAWKDNERTALYTGSLDRFVDPLTYTIHLGDAWTDRASVEMIPLPIVEPKLRVTAPEYARGAIDDRVDPSAHQISVLEGSQVSVALECTNGKRLADAWMTVTSGKSSERLTLTRVHKSGRRWSLDTADTPFAAIENDLRFEIQVKDEDGLHLESPVRGFIRIRPDRPPTGTIHWVHKLALPTARLALDYNITDDFGIARLVLHTQVERPLDEAAKATSEPGTEAEDEGRQSKAVPIEQPSQRLSQGRLIEHNGQAIEVTDVVVDASADEEDPDGCLVTGKTAKGHVVKIPLRKRQLVRIQQPVTKSALPLQGRCKVDLSQLGLQKGDRLKVDLEIVDYRGDKSGKSTRSDSLVLEITDESGVLAAVSEEDERSEKQLTDIIKRQLGIGESP